MASTTRKVALIMGVANKRSIAWACMEKLLENDFDCIVTCQERQKAKVDKLLLDLPPQTGNNSSGATVLGNVACEVQHELPGIFSNQLPDLLRGRKIDTVLHSIAYADFEDTTLGQASWEAYAQAQHISAYSFLEMARCATDQQLLHPKSASLTTLSFLGGVRAMEPYHIMGPAKASLEALVRGLALEYGRPNDPKHGEIRVNAVSAGPLNTLSGRGVKNLSTLREWSGKNAPLGRNATLAEVAATVHFLATAGTGITGQTIYVDGGVSAIGPVPETTPTTTSPS